ncbi:MAG: carboxymuconolactone decarboxylase family protein [Planctomycetota bacterium]
MPVTPPIEYDQLDDAGRAAWDEIKARNDGRDPWVELKMMARSPAVMRDAFDASTAVAAEAEDGPLDGKQIEAIRLAVSSANNCHHCVRAHSKKAAKLGWSEAEVSDILGLAAVCSMLNAYHRFRDLAGLNDDARVIDGLPAESGLPHAAILRPDRLDPMLVELVCMAVSSILACPQCTKYHRQAAVRHGATDDHIAQTVRAAAVMTLHNTYFRTQ